MMHHSHSLSERAGAFDEIDMDDEQCCRRNDGEWRRKAKDLYLRPVKMRIYVMPVYRGAKLVLRIVKQAGPRKGLRKGRVVPSFSRGPFSVSKDDRVLRVYLRWRRLLGIHML